jgi:CheY-like chemotaxis protein
MIRVMRQASPFGSGPGTAIRVLVADDLESARVATKALVEMTPGFVLVGEAESGVEALELCGREKPDLVLLDVRMPGMDGFETERELRRRYPGTKVVLLSTYESASGVVAKNSLSSALLELLGGRRSVGTEPVTTTPPAGDDSTSS